MTKITIVQLLFASLLMILTSCEDSLTVKPAKSELVGLWKCKQLPKGFLKSIGNLASVECSIQFNTNGSFVAKSIPHRDPHRLIDLQGTWRMLDPSMTPSGKWSVEINGTFLRLVRRGGKLVLKQSIDVLNGYEAEYEQESSR